MGRHRGPWALPLLLVTALSFAACSSGDDGADTGATDDAADGGGSGDAAGAGGPDCDPTRPAPDTGGEQPFSFGGEDRAYRLAVPDGYDGTTAHPLVLNFHGFGNDKEGFEAVTEMAERATARGYVVVTPDALGEPREWNMFGDEARADDFGFVDALVVELGEQLCIDEARVYASGHSNGSAFTGFLACKEPFRFTAVAMVAAFIPTTCPVEEVTPPVVAVHGTADPGVPYAGGSVAGGPVGIPPVLDTFAGYGDQYGCDRPAAQDEPAPGVERQRLTGCAHGSEVVLYTIVDGTHSWPGGPDSADAGTAGEGQAFPATEAILDFFDAHAG